jgi:predicted nucleotidyltransferase
MESALLDALFDGQRQKALAYLFLRPGSAVHVREIARATGAHAGSLHRELTKLATAGLLVREAQGNQVLYRADPRCPVFSELASLFRKTVGVTPALRNALAPFAEKIRTAFVYGSLARGDQHAASDIDLFVIGDVSFKELVAALHECQTALTREINPSLYNHAEFHAKLASGDGFLREVIAQPKLFVLGSDDDLGQPGSHWPPATPYA